MMPQDHRCEITLKRMFTEAEAIDMVSRRSDLKSHYLCIHCAKWHVTSMANGDKKASKYDWRKKWRG